MDIRNYFATSNGRKKAAKKEDSSDPEEESATRSETVKSKRKRVKRIVCSDSDSDHEKMKEVKDPKKSKDASESMSNGKHDQKSPQTSVNVSQYFASKSSSDKTGEVSKKKKKTPSSSVSQSMAKRKKSSDFDNDDDFDAMLVEIKEEDFNESPPVPKKAKLSSSKTEESSKESKNTKKTTTNNKSRSEKNKKPSYELTVEENPTKIKTPVKTKEDPDFVAATPQDDYEIKKKKHQEQYRQFLSRGGAKNPGTKEVPELVPGCLDKLVFVLTGVYESLEREEAADIIKKCGGKVTTSLSKNTTYLVVGDQAGDSKLKKADALGTKILNEDSLLNLIRELGANSKKVQKSDKNSDKSPPSESKEKTETKKSKKRINEKENSPEPKISDTKEDISANGKKEETNLWVEKYKPTSIKAIIGQQGDRSNMNKLIGWLNNWSKYYGTGNTVKPPPRPAPWATAGDLGGWAKCALLSGPPGVGKTTTAHLVSKELGYDVMELNASDARSKKSLDSSISQALISQSLSSVSKKRILLMDEVDGMAGNEDRGGVAELISLIKSSKIPVICMCNDRNHPKIRSLANYCFDLRFQRPRPEQIKAAMMSVCFKEKLKMSPEAIMEIVKGCNQDIRQVLHHLSMAKARENSDHVSLTKEEATKEAEMAKKTSIKIGPWDVCKKVFSSQDHKSMSLFDKSDLFFHDYSIGPLFVQENYLSVTPDAANKDRKKTMELVSMAAESLCVGDMVEKIIRSQNRWSLLPINAMFSSVFPGEYMSGFLHGQIQFPAWLGKNSRRGKMDRILQELAMHSRLSAGVSKESLNFDYIQHLRSAIVDPLRHEGIGGISKSIKVMEAYSLLREDLDNLLECSQWPNGEDLMKGVETKVKSAFTRAYNKEVVALPYALVQTVKKKASSSTSDMYPNDDDDEEEEDVEEDKEDISKDAMIKAKTNKKVAIKKEEEKKKPNNKGSKGKKK